MTTVGQVSVFMDEFAPPGLAEEWDNVGLLVGAADAPVQRVMTCLTVTPDSVREAVGQQADVIVSHHPLPFRPLRRITADSVAGRLLLELIEARIAVISPHTAFDSAAEGINQRLATGFGLQEISPLVASADEQVSGLGAGRWGRLASPVSLQEVAEMLKGFLKIERLRHVGALENRISKVAVACGSGGDFASAARGLGADVLVTGEASFHSCLEAESTGLCLLLPGHFASERFAVEELAGILQSNFSNLDVWACRSERDPIGWR